MTTDFIAELISEKRQLRIERLFREMEHQLTPLELQALLPSLEGHTGFLGKLVASSGALDRRRWEAAEPYVVSDPYPGIRFFTDPNVPREQKALLVGFCDLAARLLLPTGQFVQFLPASKFDILTLADEPNRYFENGAGTVRGTLPEWVGHLAKEFRISRYREVYCFGASMGGFPALRAASLFGAKRSVSASGSFAWPVGRLRAGERVPAFDPLCACRPQDQDLVLLYSSGHSRDARQAETVHRRVGARLMPVEGVEHNAIHRLFLTGKLDEFLGTMFDFEPKSADARRTLPRRPKARKSLGHHLRRLLERVGLRQTAPAPPIGFVRPPTSGDRRP